MSVSVSMPFFFRRSLIPPADFVSRASVSPLDRSFHDGRFPNTCLPWLTLPMIQPHEAESSVRHSGECTLDLLERQIRRNVLLGLLAELYGQNLSDAIAVKEWLEAKLGEPGQANPDSRTTTSARRTARARTPRGPACATIAARPATLLSNPRDNAQRGPVRRSTTKGLQRRRT